MITARQPSIGIEEDTKKNSSTKIEIPMWKMTRMRKKNCPFKLSFSIEPNKSALTYTNMQRLNE